MSFGQYVCSTCHLFLFPEYVNQEAFVGLTSEVSARPAEPFYCKHMLHPFLPGTTCSDLEIINETEVTYVLVRLHQMIILCEMVCTSIPCVSYKSVLVQATVKCEGHCSAELLTLFYLCRLMCGLVHPILST